MTDTPRIPESLLAHIWKGQWILKGPLCASDGRMIQVRSLGIENKDSGPDFLNAIIIFDDEIVTGDIELHVKSSDWRSHGHQHDPHFNSTILQVVLWDDSKKHATLHNGQAIPTLSLHPYLNGSMDDMAVRAEKQEAPSLPCRNIVAKLGTPYLSNILKRLGLDRFYVKSAYYEVELILEEPNQVIYQGIMGALGYTKNKTTFDTLARKLPIEVIQNIVQENRSKERVLVLQALLLGAAGLLPSQYERKQRFVYLSEIGVIEDIWNQLEIKTVMNYEDWHFFRMHPSNFPDSRLIAAAYLLDKYLEAGLHQQICEVIQRIPDEKGSTAIEKAFVIDHILGKERAREIAINVILPCFFAIAQQQKDFDLKIHILQLYMSYPKSIENQITRYISRLFWGQERPRITGSAQLQQGMIHLYKTSCMEQRCCDCHIISSSV